MHRGLPSLEVIGADLLRTSWRMRSLSLGAPFVGSALYFACALRGWWALALVAAAGVAFSTYGSTSHDLVHGNLGLRRAANEGLLALTELLALRSGHAYRVSHFAHHRHFPEREDAEGRPATRRYRGRLVPALLLQHLYHLEHHLYPMVPAHQWRELSRRLDPYLDAIGVAPVRIP